MRDTDIQKIRSVLGLDSTASTALEAFQNNTLRPVLKLQHDLLKAIFRHQIVLRKNSFFALNAAKQAIYVEETVKNDTKFKNRLVGLVIGHFTLEEYQFFQDNETELTRRLTQLLIQRLQSMSFD
jgi:hypothetical protein